MLMRTNPFNVVTKPVIMQIKEECKNHLIYVEQKRLRSSNKKLSEDISSFIENAIEDHNSNLYAPKVDSKPDIVSKFDETFFIELKSSTGDNWRGGNYSKREGYHIFIKWNKQCQFFIAGCYVSKKDWKESRSKSYYATSFGKKQLMEAKKKGILDIYCGDIVEEYTKDKSKVKGIKIILS